MSVTFVSYTLDGAVEAQLCSLDGGPDPSSEEGLLSRVARRPAHIHRPGLLSCDAYKQVQIKSMYH